MLREPTVQARMLMDALREHGIDVHEEYNDGHKSIDLAIPTSKLYVEVDGIQHLTDPKQISSDLYRDFYSSEEGFGTIHVHNWEVEKDVDKIAAAIAETALSRERIRSRYLRKGVDI